MSYQSGDKCPRCGKDKLRCITSVGTGQYQRQRLECKACGHRETTHVLRDNLWLRSTIER